MLMYDFLESEKYFADKDLLPLSDLMTGLLSRDAVESYAQYLIEEKTPFSFLICDIDNFRMINDAFGHVIGDKAIAFFAELVTEVFGSKGIIGRYEGDSFIVVIPEVVEYDEVWQMGYLATQYMTQVQCDAIGGRGMTCTIGLSRYPESSDNLEDLLVMADKALYRGKLKGRNCFIIYLPEKHANIYRSAAAANMNTTMDMHEKVTAILMDKGSIRHNINYLLDQLVSTLMIDHIAIQDEDSVVMEKVHPLSDVQSYHFIPNNLLASNASNFGYCFYNNYTSLEASKQYDFLEELKRQGITAGFHVRISCRDEFYGFLRADSSAANGRIWQNSQMDVLVNFANTLGMILYYENKTLKEI